MKHSNTQTIGVRIPKTLRKMLKACLKTNISTSQSEFIRTAIREKIQRDFPQIWQLFTLTEEQKNLSKILNTNEAQTSQTIPIPSEVN